MTQEQHGQDAGKPAADDVAADMERRLDELGEHVQDAERQAAAIPDNPLSSVAGDPEAMAEGPLSGGATLSAAEERGGGDDVAKP
jgi:hypothetical protein